MAHREYDPIPVSVRMSDYGYWIAEISVSPWQRMSVMIAATGISPDQARTMAMSMVPSVLGRKQVKP